MKTSPAVCFIMAVMLLLQQPVAAYNWQGTGDLSNDNLTVIWEYIHANLKTYSGSSTYNLFVTALSDQLNNRWDPAWNVITVEIIDISSMYNDIVLYGYAFRNHWMWFNGYSDPSIQSVIFSFVIWKDYNCQTFKTIGRNAAYADAFTGFSNDQTKVVNTYIRTLTVQQLRNDPWTVAKGVVDTVQASSQFVVDNNHAFSVALGQTQSLDTSFFARVCVVGDMHFYASTDSQTGYLTVVPNVGYYGNFILFQTR